jgi:uncharacterized protein (DUF433 family)
MSWSIDVIDTPSTVHVPLRQEADGTIRIGKSRVLLEILIRAFLRGASAEAIVESYPSLGLDEVYAVIAYYLANRAEVDSYMQQMEAESKRVREALDAKQPQLIGLRERLMKRLNEEE